MCFVNVNKSFGILIYDYLRLIKLSHCSVSSHNTTQALPSMHRHIRRATGRYIECVRVARSERGINIPNTVYNNPFVSNSKFLPIKISFESCGTSEFSLFQLFLQKRLINFPWNEIAQKLMLSWVIAVVHERSSLGSCDTRNATAACFWCVCNSHE